MSSSDRRQLEQLDMRLREAESQLAELRASDHTPRSWIRRGNNGGGLAMTPEGGIPARTGAGSEGDPFVWGSATCENIAATDGEIEEGTYTVYNSVDSAIGGDEVIQWKWIGSMRFADVEGC
ncbi:hypothetical protein [Aureliella helgolandensis]|uniref:Uncharacterized protein n=1 Tax=Aureliella helgolandensis TaxID=2527968 RepID=A0A518G2T3_9BACT|nr:hypothetical protein [Aureliella helgolandensis]QDV22911.1 hypothetical protein Q31a_12040 [Aureliella helgolandensis]